MKKPEICGFFNANYDAVFKTNECDLSKVLSGREFQDMFETAQQCEKIIDVELYRRAFKTVVDNFGEPKLRIGGNVGNILNVLCKELRCNATLFTPWPGRVPEELRSFVNIISLNKRGEQIDEALPHLVFETELRRVIVTPQLPFKIDIHDMKSYDIAVISGSHLLTTRELSSFLSFAGMLKAKFKFCELAHFQEQNVFQQAILGLSPFVDLFGMSNEEYSALEKAGLIGLIKNYFTHSKDHLHASDPRLFPILKKSAKICSRALRDSRETIGLGDMFSALVITDLFRNSHTN